MKGLSYASRKAPAAYRCSKCRARNRKLWRHFADIRSPLRLLCSVCACANQNISGPVDANGKVKAHYGFTDQIGTLIPAVPLETEDSFWGYTAVPDEGVAWWKALPTRDP